MNGSKTFNNFVGSNTVPNTVPTMSDVMDNALRSAFVPRFDALQASPFYSIPHLAQYGALRGAMNRSNVANSTNLSSHISPFGHVVSNAQTQQNLLSQFLLSQSAFGSMTDGSAVTFSPSTINMTSPYLSSESAFFPTNQPRIAQRYLAPPTISSTDCSTQQRAVSPIPFERSTNVNKSETSAWLSRFVQQQKRDLCDVSEGKPFVIERPFVTSESSKMEVENKKLTMSSSRLTSASLPIQPYYPSHFMKGTIIQLADGSLKPVEELNTEDFVRSAYLTEKLKINTSTVTKIEKKSVDVVTLHFSVGETKVQVSVEATAEHPFFVIGQGWSSCNPERTENLYGLPCQRLRVGDVCISLTQNDETLKKSVQDATMPVCHKAATEHEPDSVHHINSHRKSFVPSSRWTSATEIKSNSKRNSSCHLPTNYKRLKTSVLRDRKSRFVTKSRSLTPSKKSPKTAERKLSLY